ncbi:hypothetical protein [Candidatus Avelusimicrobium alvi]|uniref:hypothetical protein n=1 Tax=Candidatus Avelusimicrobium alvi TaxID=3416221 RepID=UPI003D0D5D39
MKIPPVLYLIIALACAAGLLWTFQVRPSKEWPILLLLAVLGGWLAPGPKK